MDKTLLYQHAFDKDVVRRTATPFYYYDMDVLQATLAEVNRQAAGHPFRVHYAVKANGNPHILKNIANHGLGADLVSGGEVKAAIAAGFDPQEMTFSGVGKTDWEIRLGIENGIGCFNVESIPELEVINQLAGEMGKTANIAFRINPDIDAHTHQYITTGTAANKFGIGLDELDEMIGISRAHSLGKRYPTIKAWFLERYPAYAEFGMTADELAKWRDSQKQEEKVTELTSPDTSTDEAKEEKPAA
jgi:diaminopimelate decarboxylase